MNSDPVMRKGNVRNIGVGGRHVAGHTIILRLMFPPFRKLQSTVVGRMTREAFLFVVGNFVFGRRFVHGMAGCASQRCGLDITLAAMHLLEMPHDGHGIVRVVRLVVELKIAERQTGAEVRVVAATHSNHCRGLHMALCADALL